MGQKLDPLISCAPCRREQVELTSFIFFASGVFLRYPTQFPKGQSFRQNEGTWQDLQMCGRCSEHCAGGYKLFYVVKFCSIFRIYLAKEFVLDCK